MFQKEVAERIASIKGKKKGILSVLLQAFYEIEYCFQVDSHHFYPPPKVKSWQENRISIYLSESVPTKETKSAFISFSACFFT